MTDGLVIEFTERYKGLTTLPPPNPTDWGPMPLRIATGMGIRSTTRENTTNLKLLVAGTRPGFETIEVKWRDIHTSDGVLDAAEVDRIVDELDRLDVLKLGGPIRLFAGYQAPDWVRALCGGTEEGGGFTLYTNDGWVTGDPAPSNSSWKKLPRPSLCYWHPTAAEKYRQLLSLLPDTIISHNAFCGITMSLPTTQYAEPGVNQMTLPENRQAMVASGYTREGQRQAWINGINAHAEILNPQRAATMIAFNYIQQISDSGGFVTNAEFMLEMMDYFVNTCKRMAVIENNSHQNPQNKYPKLYPAMKLYGKTRTNPQWPIWLQTETGPNTELLYDTDTLARPTVGPLYQMSTALSDYNAVAFEMFNGAEYESIIDTDVEADRAGLPKGTSRWAGITEAQASEFNLNAFENSVGKHEYYYKVKDEPPPPDPEVETDMASYRHQAKTGWVEDGAMIKTQSGSSWLRMPPSWAIDAGMRHVCLQVGADEILNVSASGTTLNTTKLNSLVAPLVTWNTNNPTKKLTLHLRVQVGESAPAYWQTYCGTIRQGDSNFDKEGLMPIWWRAQYKTMYEDMWAVLGPWADAQSYIGSVSNPMASHFYSEPFLMFPDSITGAGTPADPSKTNEERLLETDWTVAKQKAFMEWAATIPGKHTNRAIVYLALNPAKLPTQTTPDIAWLWKVVDIHLASVPSGRGGLENYSIKEGFITSGSYKTMYERMSTYKMVAWLSVQCARAKKLADPASDSLTRTVWPTISTQVIKWGFHGIETPGHDPDNLGTANKWDTSFASRQPRFSADNSAFIENVTKTSQGKGDDPDPTVVRKLSGVVGWVSSYSTAQLEQILSKKAITGLSAFQRWDAITTDGVNFNWAFMDRVKSTCEAADKYWAAMIISGYEGNGMPNYVFAGLPSDEIVTIGGEKFPAFWSNTAKARFKEFKQAFATRYGSTSNFAQFRITGFWGKHGEPWMLGGEKGKEAWTKQWDAWCGRTGKGTAGYDNLVAAYQVYEKEIWLEAASMFPKYITLSQAAGDAFRDVVGSKPFNDPGRHPDRLATWSSVRASVGNRFVGQFNGAGPGDGASGYITWLAASFGPDSAKPSRIGAQPVGGVTSGNVRQTTTEFAAMLNTLAAKKYSFFELYHSDALAASDPTPSTEGAAILAAINSHVSDWQA